MHDVRDESGFLYAQRYAFSFEIGPQATKMLGRRQKRRPDILVAWWQAAYFRHRSLSDHSYEHDAPLEIAVWTDEEGSRSAPATIASGIFAGAFTEEYRLSCKDRDGKIIGEELDRIGYRCDAALPRFKAFFEAHMEEGPLRQAGNMTAGVVTGIQGIR